MGTVDLECRYERILTAEEAQQMLEEAPKQVHNAPGQQGDLTYWFEIVGTLDGKQVYDGAFYVCADSLEAARQHAETVLARFGTEVRGRLQHLDN